MAGGLRGLGGIARDVLGGGGHFVHRGGYLIDFNHLLVHALVGANGDVCGVFRGIADALNRGHHLADHRLQLGQKGVEAFGDGAQFVSAIAGQASGQVAFALSDVVEHCHHLPQRPGNAVAHQPDHQQAEAGNHQPDHGHAEGVGLALFGQVTLQFVEVGHHRAQRQLQHQGPVRIGLADAEGQVQADGAVGLVDVVGHFAALEAGQLGQCITAEHVADFFTELARVLGIGDQATVTADQGHVPGAAVELLVGAHQHVLDEVH